MAPTPDQTITVVDGVFVLEEVLGEGGMAKVYRASVVPDRFDYTTLYAYTQVQADTHAGRLRKAKALAVKLKGEALDLATIRRVLELQEIPLPGPRVALKFGEGAGNRERFESEWTNLLCLNHDHVVKVYGGGVHAGQPYYAMELLEGIVPSRRIVEEFTLLDRIGVVLQAGAGLAYLHGKGIVHRDMKLTNALTVARPDGSYRTVVTDLGLVKNLEADSDRTNTNVVMGTPCFMSPEQMQSPKDVDHRTDIYSLGCMLYELVTRRKPYHDKASLMDILQAAARGERPIPPERHVEGLPANVAEIIRTAMAFEVQDRYQTMGEFLGDLAAFSSAEREGLGEAVQFDRFKAAGGAQAERAWHYRTYAGRGEGARPALTVPGVEWVRADGPARGVEREPAGKTTGRRMAYYAAAGVAAVALLAAAFLVGRGGFQASPGPAPTGLPADGNGALSRPTPPPPASAGRGWPFDAQEARRRQEAAAGELKAPLDLSVDLGGGVALALVLVPAGEFMMGSPPGEPNRGEDERRHKVDLTRPFYLGRHEFTQEQWMAVMGGTQPSRFQGKPDSARRPVEKVSWSDVVYGLLPRLNARCGAELPAGIRGWTFRLPTEAQWEYACRAGTATAFSCGDVITPAQANFNAALEVPGQSPPGLVRDETVAVGGFPPNAWGLSDMHGNVAEWCADFHDDYGPAGVVDPAGPAAGPGRVNRGGCWYNDARSSRSASRDMRDPGKQYVNIGFRLLLGPAGP